MSGVPVGRVHVHHALPSVPLNFELFHQKRFRIIVRQVSHHARRWIGHDAHLVALIRFVFEPPNTCQISGQHIERRIVEQQRSRQSLTPERTRLLQSSTAISEFSPNSFRGTRGSSGVVASSPNA